VSVAVGAEVSVGCGGSTVGAISVGAGWAGGLVGAAGARVLVGGVDCDPLVAVGGTARGNGLLEEHADAITSTTIKTSHSNRRRIMRYLHVIVITVSMGTAIVGATPLGEVTAPLRTTRDR
jgi:hypothetical protein